MLKMDRILSTVLILSVVAFIAVNAYNTYDLPDYFEVDQTYDYDSITKQITLTSGKNCTKAGFMCEDCKNVSFCVQIAGGWIKEDADKCGDGQTCLDSTGQCTSGSNPPCEGPSDYKFVCNQEGIFPDPFNCQTYHLCIQKDGVVVSDPLTMKCDGSFYYNVKTTLCSKRMLNNTCPIFGNPCVNVTSQGPVPDNPAMFYLCLKTDGSTKYYPQFYLCLNNQEYNEVTKLCEDPTPKPAAGTDGKCLAKGFFYDPTTCFYYYECIAAAQYPIRRVCPGKMYYSNKYQKCVDFTCKGINIY